MTQYDKWKTEAPPIEYNNYCRTCDRPLPEDKSYCSSSCLKADMI